MLLLQQQGSLRGAAPQAPLKDGPLATCAAARRARLHVLLLGRLRLHGLRLHGGTGSLPQCLPGGQQQPWVVLPPCACMCALARAGRRGPLLRLLLP